MIVSVLFISVFGLFYANISVNNGITYDTSQFSYFNKTAELQGQIEDINQTLTSFNSAQSSTSALDIVGAFFSSGYQVLKASFTSITTFTALSGDAVEQLPLGDAGALFRASLLMIIVVAFFFIVISILVSKEV